MPQTLSHGKKDGTEKKVFVFRKHMELDLFLKIFFAVILFQRRKNVPLLYFAITIASTHGDR